MKILRPRAHGILDLVTVVAFALAPTVLDLSGAAAGISYVVAGLHLVMTLVTDGLPASIGRLVPLPLHGLVEAFVGVALGLIGWLAFDDSAQAFYLVMGIAILIVFTISTYLPARS